MPCAMWPPDADAVSEFGLRHRAGPWLIVERVKRPEQVSRAEHLPLRGLDSRRNPAPVHPDSLLDPARRRTPYVLHSRLAIPSQVLTLHRLQACVDDSIPRKDSGQT